MAVSSRVRPLAHLIVDQDPREIEREPVAVGILRRGGTGGGEHQRGQQRDDADRGKSHRGGERSYRMPASACHERHTIHSVPTGASAQRVA